ncbi:MAG TPA: type II secretion system F family protein [bacterium]|nr:type II secretion system F family protein [bacterium]
MALYSYKAKTTDGRVIDGQIEVDSEKLLTDRLKAQKMTVVSITKMGGLAYIFNMGPKVTPDKVSIFSRQFSTMISAGLPVLQALNILCEQADDKVFKEVLGKIRDDIGGGANLSDAMAKFPSVFDPLYCNMIKAGELSGALDQILDRLSTFLEKAEGLKKKIKSAMTYPVTILVISAVVVIILMVKVVPTFETVFESFGGELPPPTKFLLAVSEFEQKWAWLQILLMIAAGIAFTMAKKTEAGGLFLDTQIMKMPVFGPLTKKAAVARFARTLGTLLKSGVQILDALETVARSSGNKAVEKALLETRAAVREGKSLTEPMKETGIFPPMVVQMVSVGEETGQLDDMLLRMSDFYDEEVDTAVEGLMSMIEPLIMAVLGVVIGGMVVAMFLPMFSMGSMVS